MVERDAAAIDDEKRIPGAYHVPNTPSPPSGNSAEGEGEAAQRRGLPMTPGTIQLESLHSQVEDLSSRLREAEAQRTKAEQERDRAQRLLETYHERDMGELKEYESHICMRGVKLCKHAQGAIRHLSMCRHIHCWMWKRSCADSKCNSNFFETLLLTSPSLAFSLARQLSLWHAHHPQSGAMKEEQDRMEKLKSKGFRGVDINSLMSNPIEEREPREFGF